MITGVRIHLKPGVSGNAYLAGRAALEPMYQWKLDVSSGTNKTTKARTDTEMLLTANLADDLDTEGAAPIAPLSGDTKWVAQFNAYCEITQGMARHRLELSASADALTLSAAEDILPANWYYRYLSRQMNNWQSPEQEQKWQHAVELHQGRNDVSAPSGCQPLYLITELVTDPTFKFTEWYAESDLGNFGNFMESYDNSDLPDGSASIPLTFGETRYLNCKTQRFKLVQA